jgi:hypothetical protein
MKIDGGCHCGYITYEAEVDPEQTAICHCTDCQTLSGSAFRTVIPAPDHNFRILSGEPAIYVKTGESGAKRPQGFCPRCGSPIYSTAVGDGPKSYFIRVVPAPPSNTFASHLHLVSDSCLTDARGPTC